MFVLSTRGGGRCLCCARPPKPWLIMWHRPGRGAADRPKSERAHAPEGSSRLRPIMNKALSDRPEPQTGGDNPGGSSYRTKMSQEFPAPVSNRPAAALQIIAHRGVVGLPPVSVMTYGDQIYATTGGLEAIQRQARGDRSSRPVPAEFASLRNSPADDEPTSPVTNWPRPWTFTHR